MTEVEPPAERGFRFRQAVEVRFADIDFMGHAHHSRPLQYFEEARAAYWRTVAGRPAITDIDYLLAEVTVKFHARIGYPQRVLVDVRVTDIGRRSFTMEYEIRSTEGALLASGRSVQVMYDYENSVSMEIPADLRQRIAEYERGPARGT